jgi:hypothetical protein
MAPRIQPIRDRFYAKTRRDEATGCLNWTAATWGPQRRYGRISWNGGSALAHRVAWIVERGPIPDGYEIDHLCKNTLCVEVSHLEPVPPHVNRGRAASPSSLNAVKTECPLGHPYNAENTYYDRDGGRDCRACRRRRSQESRQRRAGRAA